MTQKPDSNRMFGYLEGTLSDTAHYGSDNESVRGALNAPIAPGQLAVRVSGYYDNLSGYIKEPGRRRHRQSGEGRPGAGGGPLDAHRPADRRRRLHLRRTSRVR
ncbi:MAG: hypothetical protein WDM92_00810 [Caulobacteraceae bacterium]